MRNIKKVLGTRVMIKPLSSERNVGGLTIRDDGQSLPLAEIILLSKEVIDLIEKGSIERFKVGDIVHYVVSRESGKCRHNDEEHFITPIGNLIAVVDE